MWYVNIYRSFLFMRLAFPKYLIPEEGNVSVDGIFPCPVPPWEPVSYGMWGGASACRRGGWVGVAAPPTSLARPPVPVAWHSHSLLPPGVQVHSHVWGLPFLLSYSLFFFLLWFCICWLFGTIGTVFCVVTGLKGEKNVSCLDIFNPLFHPAFELRHLVSYLVRQWWSLDFGFVIRLYDFSLTLRKNNVKY